VLGGGDGAGVDEELEVLFMQSVGGVWLVWRNGVRS